MDEKLKIHPLFQMWRGAILVRGETRCATVLYRLEDSLLIAGAVAVTVPERSIPKHDRASTHDFRVLRVLRGEIQLSPFHELQSHPMWKCGVTVDSSLDAAKTLC